MSKSLSLERRATQRPAGQPLRHLAAMGLRAASALLARAARKLRRPSEEGPYLPEVEFHELHSESGAPEGALYIDGKLVAILPVSRL
jgi:hypothetical protein